MQGNECLTLADLLQRSAVAMQRTSREVLGQARPCFDSLQMRPGAGLDWHLKLGKHIAGKMGFKIVASRNEYKATVFGSRSGSTAAGKKVRVHSAAVKLLPKNFRPDLFIDNL